jgi:hypothetical protein
LPGWTRLVDATAPELGICVELFPSDDIAERTESDTLESVRDILIAAGLSLIPRDESDDAVIVECWL